MEFQYFISDNELEVTNFEIEIEKNGSIYIIKHKKITDHPFFHITMFHKTTINMYRCNNKLSAYNMIIKMLKKINLQINKNIDIIDLPVSKYYISEYCGISEEIFESEKNKYKNLMLESKIKIENDIKSFQFKPVV